MSKRIGKILFLRTARRSSISEMEITFFDTNERK